MNYWELGCNWGKGRPDFCDFIKEKQIVLCWNRDMKVGDYVAICKGFMVWAIAVIAGERKACNTNPDLKQNFLYYRIDYDRNYYAPANFYELSESERFEYEVQKGISQIHKQDIIDKLSRIFSR